MECNSRSVAASPLGSACVSALRLVPFRLVPFVVWTREPALRPPPPPPIVEIPEEDKDDSELFARILKDLMALLEDDESKSRLFRLRITNKKLARTDAATWTRLVKKLLLLMRNDRKTRSAIGA